MSTIKTKSSATGAPGIGTTKNTLANFTGPPPLSGTRITPGVQSNPNKAAPSEHPEIYPLAEVLRSDITTDWVYARWNRKSAGLADPGMFGIRVPLVTGTLEGDLAGSLSYYFNNQNRLQRISLRARTGDPTQIVNLVVQRFGFQPQPPTLPGEQLYQVIHHKKVKSELRIRPESVLLTSSPHTSYSVALELEDPTSNRYLAQTVFSTTPPTDIAGIPINPSQLKRPEPVPIAPFSFIAKTVTKPPASTPKPDSPAKENTPPQSAEETPPQPAEGSLKSGLPQRFRWPN
ncbi:MAG: hypothetical protein MK161_11860 [Pirellulales bacterium]|nr:hypothetical protein [Pirellulales bacterium]